MGASVDIGCAARGLAAGNTSVPGGEGMWRGRERFQYC